ncbi:unnamed protein product [Caenorhabditis bovis]|uniref:Tubulin-specific chaperone E n=1 Tax=Caenorhabditis bovis TaxID=2654633 RepID=A0A8S1F497_9PELO|nr:unnamed protein product [Caenorhabditis bovis]
MVRIGDRVRVDDHLAVVRYIGNVDGYGDQIWLGLEWKDPKRGRHDGCVKGRRYFQTRHPTGGSLTKIENVQLPCDLLAEIKSRYIESDDGVQDQIDLAQTTKKIELVGMRKTATQQANIEKLVNIVLDNRSVGEAPPNDAPMFRQCKELNLYANLVYKWHTVKHMLKFFPKIQELNLRRNWMIDIDEDRELVMEEQTFGVAPFSETCTKLILSECDMKASSNIDAVLRRFPACVELVAFGNELAEFGLDAAQAARLTCLDLQGNPLRSLSAIKGIYANVRCLNVAKCEIRRIGDFSEAFPNLEFLNLRENLIAEWNSVNSLQKLNKLKNLLIDHRNFKLAPGINAFEVFIAKLPNLMDFNRFDVSEVERRSAEIRFLNNYFGIKDEELRNEHLHDIQRLVKIYGEPTVDATTKGLKVVKLRIEYGNRVETRNLPLAMNVQKVKDMLSRLFKIGNSQDIAIYLVMCENHKQHRIELDNPLRELGHYSPSEERDILVIEHKS